MLRAVFDFAAHETTPAAPGELELIQRFMNLHEHRAGVRGDLPPSPELVKWFLVDRGLMDDGDPWTHADHKLALDLIEALHAKVRENYAEPAGSRDVAVIDRVTDAAGLTPRFGLAGPPRLEPKATGAAGGLGGIVAIAFLAQLDGRWGHLKNCAHETCRGVFFDHSKNHSGKWCSMQKCGNRAKAKAWRERHEARGRRA